MDSRSLDSVDVEGKIVLVFDNVTSVAGKGMGGVILAQKPDHVPSPSHSLPVIFTDYETGTDILEYIRTTRSLS